LSNHTDPPPDPESRSPGSGNEPEAPKIDRLAGSIESTDTPTSQNLQATRCEHCEEIFAPRKGSGGKPQRFCSTECRKAFHAGAVPNIHDAPDDVGADVGKTPQDVDNGTATWRLPSYVGHSSRDQEEFNWRGPDVVIRNQYGTAVYFNPHDELVIRQERPDNDEDSFVFIQQAFIQEFLERLCDACGIPSVP
jgi:hypothetical protein